jgi:hypothetical protein
MGTKRGCSDQIVAFRKVKIWRHCIQRFCSFVDYGQPKGVLPIMNSTLGLGLCVEG